MIRSRIISENIPRLDGDTLLPARLSALDRPALESHLVALGAEDRRLRFGAGLSDDAIRGYVRRIDFVDDGVFALHDEALHVVAAVHVACGTGPAELGLSVLPAWRGRGCGNALFERALTFLRNRGVSEVFVHCLSENDAMMHLARKHGMRVARLGHESNARLRLREATMETYVSEWLGDQRALGVRTRRQVLRNARAFFGLPDPHPRR